MKNFLLPAPWDIVLKDIKQDSINWSGFMILGIVALFVFKVILLVGIIILIVYIYDFFKKRKINYSAIISTYPESIGFFLILITRYLRGKSKNYMEMILTAISDKSPEEVYQTLYELGNNTPPLQKQEQVYKNISPQGDKIYIEASNSKIQKKAQSKIMPQKESSKANSQAKSIWDSYSSVSEDFKNMNSR